MRHGATAAEVEREAMNGGWLVVSCDEVRDGKTSLWTPADPAERAVVRGMVKGYFIIMLINLGLALVGWSIYAIAAAQ